MVLKNENATNCSSVVRKYRWGTISGAGPHNNNRAILRGHGFVEVKRSVLKSENRNVYSVEVKR